MRATSNRTAVLKRTDFLSRDDFVKSLRRMKQSGGSKQKAAEKVSQIIGNYSLGSDELFKLTNHGETRIDHCVKYDLPGACRLVTVQDDSTVWFLYVGDHGQVDSWLDTHKGLKLVANKDNNRINETRFAVSRDRNQLQQFEAITDENLPFLQRISFPELPDLVHAKRLQRELLDIKEGTEDQDILDIVELIPDADVQTLIFDLLILAREGSYPQAEARLDIFRGSAVDVMDDQQLLKNALDADTNSDSIVVLNDLPPAELERLLSPSGFEDWMLFLHPEQKKVVDEDFDRPAVLKGVSGSGKTVVLIHRARRLAQKYPGESIGILTLNRSLAKLIENLVKKLCLAGEEKQIEVMAFYDYFQKILGHVGAEDYLTGFLTSLPPRHPMVSTIQRALENHRNIANDFSPLSGETLDDTWSEFWHDDIRKDYNDERTQQALLNTIDGQIDKEAYIRDEFTLIRSAFPRDLRSSRKGDGYYSYPRTGRAIQFREAARQNVLRLLLRYEEYMLGGGMLDDLGLAQALFPAMRQLGHLPPNLAKRCLLVDEFQDFSTLELRLIKQIPRNPENGLFLTGDSVQKVLVKDFSLATALLDRNYVLTRTIKKNYRNSRQILGAASVLVKQYSKLAGQTEEGIEFLDPELATRETAKPIALKTNFAVEAAWQRAEDWIDEGGNEPWSVCLVTANPRTVPIEEIISKAPQKFKSAALSGDYVQNRDTISVGTLADVKGFEFSLIIIVGCGAAEIPSPLVPEEEQWRDALRFYVAMTRGRDQVVFTYVGKPSVFLDAMTKEIRWDECVVDEIKIEKPKRQSKPLQPQRIIIETGGATKPKWEGFTLSMAARIILKDYFCRSVYQPASGGKHRNDIRSLDYAFQEWCVPKNLDQLYVSLLFSGMPIRRDIVQEVNRELKPHGFSLIVDK